MGRSSRQTLNRKNLELRAIINQNGPNRFTEHFTQTQRTIVSSQNLIERSPKLTTYLVIDQASAETRKLKFPSNHANSSWISTTTETEGLQTHGD